MAYNSKTYVSNSIQGVPDVAGEVNLFAQDSTPRYSVGYKLETADGRVFRYVHFGAATGQGQVVSADVSETAAAEGAITLVAPASAATTTDGTAGYKFVEGTIAAIGRDAYKGGLLMTITGTGRGYTYRIKGNSVCGLPDGPASGNIRIELFDKVQETINAATGCLVVANRWSNLEAATVGTDEVPVGVTIDSVAADTYGWVQTKGPCAVLQSTTACAAGDIAVLSALNGTASAGAIASMGQFNTSNSAAELINEPIVGTVLGTATAAANGTYAAVNLMLE